jgi:hypothetical protein
MKKLTILFLLVYSLNIQAQDLKYASFNILTNGIIGGIGSSIHHNSNEKITHAFVNGFWKGCVGGGLVYASKDILRMQAKQDKLVWPLMWTSKIMDSFGNTISNNAVLNEKNILKNYSINFGFLRFSTNKYIQLEPVSFGCFVYISLIGGKLDLSRTMKVGNPVFNYSYKRIITEKDGSTINKPEKQGEILGQNIMINKGTSTNTILFHEITHTYQRFQFSNINYCFDIYNKYENIGYIHNDISVFDLLYFIQNKTIGYSNNIFEKEADYFGISY